MSNTVGFSIAAVLPLLAVGVSAIVVFLGCRQTTRAPGGRYLAGLLIATALWGMLLGAETLLVSPTAKVWTAKLQYLGVVSAPTLWFLFCIAYARQTHWLNGPGHVLVWAIPAMTIALVMTNEYHGWVWSDVSTAAGPGPLAIEHGPYFSFFTFVATSMMVLGTAVLAWTLARSGHRWQQYAAAFLAPLLVAGADVVSTWPMLQSCRVPTPHPSRLLRVARILCWRLMHRGLPDLKPVARHAVMDRIADAVFVLDLQGCIVDLNPAGVTVLGSHGSDPVGRPLAELLEAPLMGGLDLEDGGEMRDLPLRNSGEERTYDVRISLLWDGGLEPAGRVLVFRDTTERTAAVRRLEEAKAEKEKTNRELERLAHTDTLTGISNRRHFTMMLETELRRALRHGRPLSLITLDLDRFKQVNDLHGHAMGDRVLVNAAQAIQSVVREVDHVGRLGGEEFAVLIPETDMEGAFRLAERIRAAVAADSHTDGRWQAGRHGQSGGGLPR